MLLTPHAVMGATIGALAPNPALAIPLALGSHYLLDMVPHWQETLPPYTPHKGTWIRAPIDLGLGWPLSGTSRGPGETGLRRSGWRREPRSLPTLILWRMPFRAQMGVELW